MRICRRQALLAIAPLCLQGQGSSSEDYTPFTEHPRLLLRAQRLRLLRRERVRESVRWQNFERLIKGDARMPEPGFAWALYYQVAGDEGSGRRAIEWAVGATRMREVALVADWCAPLLTDSQRAALSAKLSRALKMAAAKTDIAAVRDGVFAALALPDEGGRDASKLLRFVVQEWWRKQLAPELRAGKRVLERSSVYPLHEILHAIRDELQIDLRDDAGMFFRQLPAEQLLGYYPAAYPSAENDFRIPAYTAAGEPDLQEAALSRAAEFAMVAYDNNATESQFLQGWLMHDRFMLQGPFGVPYEFLWANPYQPGLAYSHMPLRFHDPRTGRLIVRSSWDEDAMWLGYLGREIQLFHKGERKAIKAQRDPLILGTSAVLPGVTKFSVKKSGPAHYFITGLKPNARHLIEADDEEILEARSDTGGILALEFTRVEDQTVRISEHKQN